MSKDPFSKKGILQSSVIMTISTFISYFGGLAGTILIARALGPTEYGHYSYLVWLSSLVMIAANNGVNVSALRFISECMGKGEAGVAANVGGWLRKRYYASVVLVIVLVAIWLYAHHPERWGHYWPVFALAVLVSGIGKSGYLFASSIAKGYGNFSIEATTTNVFSVLTLIGVIALYFAHAPMHSFLAVFVVASMGHWVLTRYLAKKANVNTQFGEISIDLREQIWVHYRWAVALTLIAFLSNKSIEIYLLGLYSTPESIGFFSLAGGLVKAGTDLICAGITTVLMPLMAFSFGQDGLDKVKLLATFLLRVYFALGLLICGGSFFIAKPLVAIFFGPTFIPVELAFQVMGFIAGLTLIEVPLFTFLSTTNNQRFRVFIVITSLVLTAITAVLLVPKYGLLGALWGHAISRACFVLLLLITVSLNFKIEVPIKAMGFTLVAALTACAVGYGITQVVPSPLNGVAGASVYCILFLGFTVVFKVWTKLETDSVKSFVHQQSKKLNRWR
jgi:O-antigen/teichoic acid export membrane protein